MDPERFTCESLRAEILRTEILCSGLSSERESLSAPGSEHLHACAPCALWRRARLRHVAALTALERFVAPRELEALVVASFSSDSRRERAISALTRLGRLTTPAELDDALLDDVRLDGPAVEGSASERREVAGTHAARRAPRVLQRLVAEEIADPAKARARRFVGSLPRLHAVPELDQLVARELARPTRTRARGMRAAIYASLAAAVLASVIGPLAVSVMGASPKSYPFRVEHVRVDANSEFGAVNLEPSVRELLDGLGGGILGVHRI